MTRLLTRRFYPWFVTLIRHWDSCLTKYQKPNETVLGLAADPVRKTYWVYTDQSLFELVVGNEDRDVWKIHLDKRQYDTALRYAKVYVLWL